MTIQFLLNRDECAADAGPLTPTLDFLRDHASLTAAWLRGRVIDAETVNGAAEQAMREVAPMADIRGSVAYKRLLLGQLLRAHFFALAPDRIDAAALNDCISTGE